MRRTLAVLVLVFALPGRVLAAPADPIREDPAPRVLLLGTFHFADAGLDDYKPEFVFDVRSARRQRELAEVIGKLEAWKPTLILVESRPERQGRLDSLYALYPGGGLDTLRNEIFQVGFRLARRLGHDGVFAIDAPPRSFDPGLSDEEYARRAAALAPGLFSATDWNARYTALYRRDDSLKSVRTLRQTLLAMNDPERLRLGHGHYLVGAMLDGAPGDYLGADGFASTWYNRNLRIYSNIVRRIRSRDERVLVLIGAGHVPILRECLLASPVARLVEVSQVLR